MNYFEVTLPLNHIHTDNCSNSNFFFFPCWHGNLSSGDPNNQHQGVPLSSDMGHHVVRVEEEVAREVIYRVHGLATASKVRLHSPIKTYGSAT